MSSRLILYKWRVWCVTESAYVCIWLEEGQSAPTTCPNNTGHTITSSLTKIIEKHDPTNVTIEQESTITGGNYGCNSQSFTATANTTTTHTFSYPLNISVLDAQYVSAAENTGDSWSWVISPNTTVGALTADVAITDTVINVSSTVTDNIKVGFYVNLFDGVNTEELGRVLEVDGDAGTITVETASTQTFSAATPTYVRMNIYFIKNMVFGHPWNLEYGSSKIKSSYVPANTVIQVSYTNNSPSTDKTITCYIEYLY